MVVYVKDFNIVEIVYVVIDEVCIKSFLWYFNECVVSNKLIYLVI